MPSPFRPFTAAERDAVRLYGLQRRWSYAHMAREIGIPVQTLKRVLMGKGKPYETTVYAIRSWYEQQQQTQVSR